MRSPTFIVYEAIEAGHLQPLLADYQWPLVYADAAYPPPTILPAG